MDYYYIIKTCAQGSLGAMTFGIYHAYVSNKQMITIKNMYRTQKL